MCIFYGLLFTNQILFPEPGLNIDAKGSHTESGLNIVAKGSVGHIPNRSNLNDFYRDPC